MPIRAVWFDVGETLVDETREWGAWADWMDVPRHTFSAVFGAVIARGGDHREVFQHFRPGFDVAAERQARLEAGMGECVNPLDLYPDAWPCLAAFKDAGHFVGIVGNQTARAAQLLRELDLPADVVASSEEWGVEKPDPAFFGRLIAVTGLRPDEIAYVGDRLDNDVRPAVAAGLRAYWLVRGPWAVIGGDPGLDGRAERIESLESLPARLALAG